MKKFWLPLLFIVVLVTNSITFGQFSDKEFTSKWLVMNTSVIKGSDIMKVQELMDSHFETVLNDLVKEGKLESWGYLDNGALEDGNFNIYYITNSQLDFENFWGEYTKRNSEQKPNQWNELLSCFNSYQMVGQTNSLTHVPVPVR